jgi:acetyl esterase
MHGPGFLRPKVSRLHDLRRRVGAAVVDNFFSGAARLGRAVPLAHPRLHGVEVLNDVPYLGSGLPEHRLDIYRPRDRQGLLPAVLYVHGGGFRFLSKESHWLFGLLFARRGYVVFNVNYRLAPQHPFPAAVEDACRAYAWLAKNAPHYGGDPARLVVAGESAGANLATSLAIAACYQRPEAHAREVFDSGVVPRAVMPACGFLQVTDPERFAARLPWYLLDRLTEVTDAYLAGLQPGPAGSLDLADPLVMLERGQAPARPLPPFFATCGTGDPLQEDTRRLGAALARLGVPHRLTFYEGEPHAFHAFVLRSVARRHWREGFAFLEEHLA